MDGLLKGSRERPTGRVSHCRRSPLETVCGTVPAGCGATVAGVHDPNARLLLLPALGDSDLPADAADVVRGAQMWAGAPETETHRAAEALLLGHPYWEPAGWSLPSASPFSGSSKESFTGILCCDEPGSPWFGTRIAQGITREQSDRLARALGTWPTT
ncbi:hypothetical protein ACIRRH_34680 [Kitasatospora sp. NPDC101235]|uniref:hypothetical protein n=1 Tax=Kitasatospora sp. NPDC101235 TaxID=3364101 RepID=UPI0037FED4C5